jgi:hypothetical protein
MRTTATDFEEDGTGIEVGRGDGHTATPVRVRSSGVGARGTAVANGGTAMASPSVQPKPGCLPYVKSQYFLELLLCVGYAVLALVAPPYVPLNQRPIPYQTTSTGDIILDLELNHAYKQETITGWS